ncbi:SDR family oxidoreductase [Serratia sp. 14-2641]|nr:SDR family oxidoreductase [Serratia sp. 14-2641]OCJ29074.1 hypothetical protein A6U95_28250 [Serratia sp. 14-2641]
MKKFAVITGASRGIGKAITEDFIKKAVFDVMAIVRTPSLAEHLREEWTMLNPACRLVIKVVDFSDTDAVQTLCHDLGKNKNLAVLINNAGIFMPGTTDIEYQNLLDMTEVNFFAPFLLTQAVSHAMQKNKQGYIINIASNAARRVISGIGAYSASKHALLGLSGSLMLELLPHNIKVTNINPGFTNTDMTRHFPNLADDEKIQPQDIVNCISFLLSLSPGAIIPNIDVECARFP